MCRGTGFYSVPCVTNLKAAPCDELAIRSIPPGTNCVARQKPWVLLAAILASSITHIDGSVVNIALPAIESNLATSVAVIQWLVNAYTLCLSALLLTGGVAADRFGRRKMFIIGLILFAAASLWCGFALSIALLLYGARCHLLFSTVRADPGRRLFGSARWRYLPPLHVHHRIAVALVGRAGRSCRRQIAADHRAHDHSAGFGALILCIGGADYWAYLVSMTVLGLGMAVSVAPLTTTVINAVPAHQTGVASGVNNAVASLAGLLAVAIFGAVALGLYDRGLDRRLQASSVSVELRQTIQSARGNFVTTPAAAMSQGDDRQLAEMIIKGALAESIRDILLLAIILTLGAAASGALLPRRTQLASIP
jgi:MFS family permease